MANISTLTDTRWYFGLSFNESAVTSPTGNIPVAATLAQQILGDKLLGLGLSNEPDLYVDHNKRPAGWNLQNYVDEFSTIKNEVLNQGTLTNKQFLVGPSVCCNVVGFDTSDVFNAGWVDQNIDNLAALTVQQYVFGALLREFEFTPCSATRRTTAMSTAKSLTNKISFKNS